jgi:DNA-binding NtrC family response regulator
MKVMLVDDDRESLACLSNALKLNDFEIDTFESPAQAIQEYNPETIDLVVTDFHLPDTTGIDVLKAIREKNAAAPVFIISGDPTPSIREESLKAGASAFFRKPINISKFIGRIAKAVK